MKVKNLLSIAFLSTLLFSCTVSRASSSADNGSSENTPSDSTPESGSTPAHTHTYVKHEANSATCTQDGNDEYYTCSECPLIFDSNKNIISSVPIRSATGHTLSPTKSYDETNHWQVCTECDEHINVEAHNKGTNWLYDETNHWHKCTGCEKKYDIAEHTLGDTWYVSGTSGNIFRICTECEAHIAVSEHYHEGGFEVMATDGTTPATYEQYEGVIGGVTNPYVYSATTRTENNKLDVAAVNHNDKRAAWQYISKRNVKYISFSIYLTDDALLRLYCVEPTGHVSTLLRANSAIVNLENHTNLKVYNANGDQVDAMVANAWYTVVVDYRNIQSESVDKENVYPCIHLTYPEGTIYLNDCRYYMDTQYIEDYGIGATMPHEHEYLYVAEKAATCSVEGNSAYYTCTSCNLIFNTDKEVITDIPTIPTISHIPGDQWYTDTSDSTLHYRECTVCHTHLDEGTHYHEGGFTIKQTDTTNPATFSQHEGEIAGVSNPYAYVATTASWNNKLEVAAVSGDKAEVWTRINKKQIKYISFDICLATSTNTRLYCVEPTGNTHYPNEDSNPSSHMTSTFTAGSTITNLSNHTNMKVYDQDGNLVTSSTVIAANTWYTVVVDYRNIQSESINHGGVIPSIQFAYFVGSIYLNDCRYYMDTQYIIDYNIQNS